MGRDKESREGYEKGYEERGEWGDVYAKGEGAWREGHVKGNGENCERGMGRGEERMIGVLNDRRRTVMDICIWEGRWRRGAYEEYDGEERDMGREMERVERGMWEGRQWREVMGVG